MTVKQNAQSPRCIEPKNRGTSVVSVFNRSFGSAEGWAHGVLWFLWYSGISCFWDNSLTMKIAVIGAGNVGGTLGKRWQGLGHSVVFGVRNPGDAKLGPGYEVSTPEKAVEDAEVVLFALPYTALLSAAKALNLEGKILVDCTNPIAADFNGLSPIQTSAAEELAAATGSKQVVKAFNTVGFNIMENPDFNGRKSTMLVAGDDATAKSKVSVLAAELGFDPVDAGPLHQARYMEALAWLWISMAIKYGHGRDIVFNLEKR